MQIKIRDCYLSYQIKQGAHCQGSQPTWKSGKSENCQGIWKWTFFTEKIRELSGNFDLMSGKSGKNFPEFSFSVINFLLALFSVMYTFMIWNICLLFLAIFCCNLQQLTKYLRLTLVFMWNSAQREKFSFCFSRVFC